jgi:hypothetical protein
MFRYCSAFLLVFCLFGCAQPVERGRPSNRPQVPPGSFFVATNGNDLWSGTWPSPNSKRTDGPFATLSRGVLAARNAHQVAGPCAVYVRRGTYFLNQPLILIPQDSGLDLEAYPGENPVLSGGRQIEGWQAATIAGKQLWVADVPGAREGKWYFRELWINGRRAVRARHPNKGYFGVESLPDKGGDWTQGQTRFRFREGDLKPLQVPPAAAIGDAKEGRGEALETNAEVVVMSRWVESRLPVLSIDEKEHLVTFSKRSVFELAAGDPYYVEGAFAFLDEPGEWYLDQAGGKLYYLPRPGESLSRVEAIAPVLAQVLRFEGRPEANQFVERVRLSGLAFAHTEWYFPTGFQSAKNRPTISPEPKAEVGGFAQAAIGVPGAVWGEGVRACIFTNCTFSHLGNYALELARGCQQNRVLAIDFFDLGAGGVKLGETSIRNQVGEQSRANEISDCRIYDGGKLFHSAIGVWIGQSPDNRVTHNLIHDFYYTGISIGWTWGYGPALASNNIVEFNHVHHIGVKSDGDGPILSDMGGIYTLGKQPGTIVRNNLWHDIAGIHYGGWGIYFDEGSSGILAESNLVYRTTHGGFHQHYGETNLVRNNIFAFARDHQLQRTRPEPHSSFTFETNIVYFDSGALLTGNWSDNNYQLDWNVYFDARPGATADTVRFERATLEQWRARGHDRHSIVADPLFIAPRQDNFELLPASPALKLGFRPIDLTGVGPRMP